MLKRNSKKVRHLLKTETISIIVPIYNAENYLKSCLDSVLSQTFKDFEVLMVNDGSTDSSATICQAYAERDSRFRYFEKENGGLSDARNYGLDRAQGVYITFLDADDFLFENYLEKLYQASHLSDSDILIGGYCRFDGSDFYFYNDHFKSDSLNSFTSAQAIQVLDSMLDVPFLTFSTAWGKLFKRDLFDELRFPYGKYAEDQFLIWKLYMKAANIHVFNNASYVYRMNPSGLSSVFSPKHLDYIDALEERIRATKDLEGIDIQHSLNMYDYVLQRMLGQLEEHQFLEEADKVREKLELAKRKEYPFLLEQKNDLISIIVPIYNVENYLRMCLDSIQNQTYKNFEIIFSNPKSPASVITKKIQSQNQENLQDSVLGVNFNYATESFFQINLPVYEQALRDMEKFINISKPTVDLYSGVGSIGLTIGAGDLTLVEINEPAVEEMRRNITELGREKTAKAILSPSEKALDFIKKGANLIVDPPRAGMNREVREKILEIEPERVIYLSCNPTTQARDVAILSKKYEIIYARGYNFFPRTPHIENLIILELKNQ